MQKKYNLREDFVVATSKTNKVIVLCFCKRSRMNDIAFLLKNTLQN